MNPMNPGLFAQVVTVTDLIANLLDASLIGVCIVAISGGKILMMDPYIRKQLAERVQMTNTFQPITDDPDFVFVARYRAPKDAVPTSNGSEDPVIRWCSIYGTQDDAYRGAATFIRDALITSSLRASANEDVIRKIEASVRRGDVNSVIELWNDEFPKHKVKVYKGVAL